LASLQLPEELAVQPDPALPRPAIWCVAGAGSGFPFRVRIFVRPLRRVDLLHGFCASDHAFAQCAASTEGFDLMFEPGEKFAALISALLLI